MADFNLQGWEEAAPTPPPPTEPMKPAILQQEPIPLPPPGPNWPLRANPQRQAEWLAKQPKLEFPDASDFTYAMVSKGLSGGERAKILGAYSLTSDPQALQDIFTKKDGAFAIDGAQRATDKYGQPMIVLKNGTRYYLNKPGASGADDINAAPQMIAFAATEGLGNLALNAVTRGTAGTLARVATGAAVAGGTEAAREKAAQALGSQQPMSAWDIAISAALGGGGQGAASAFRSRWRPGASMLLPNGNWTPEATDLLRSLNLDPAAFNGTSRQRINSVAQAMPPQAAQPRAALRDVAAQVRDDQLSADIAPRPPVPGQPDFGGTRSTAGQRRANFDRTQGNVEDRLIKGSGGDANKETMDEFTIRQRQRIMDNAEAMTGGVDDASAGTRIGNAWRQARGTARQAYQQLYDTFDSLNPRGAVLSDDARRSLSDLGTQALDAANIRTTSDMVKTAEALRTVNALGVNPRPNLMQAMTGTAEAPRIVTVADLERVRKELGNMTSTDPSDRLGVRTILRALDDRIDAINQMPGAVNGPNADRLIPAWRDAIAARRDFGQRFELNPDRVGQGTASTFEKMGTRDNPSPEQITQWVLGSKGVPDAAGPNGLDMVNALRGAAPDTIAPLRQAYVARVMEPASVTVPRELNLPQLRKNLTKAINDFELAGPSLAKEMLTNQQAVQLRALRSHIDDIIASNRAYPSSGTAERSLRQSKDLGQWLQKEAPWLAAIVTSAGTGLGAGSLTTLGSLAGLGAGAALGGAASLGGKALTHVLNRRLLNRAIGPVIRPGPTVRSGAAALAGAPAAAGQAFPPGPRVGGGLDLNGLLEEPQ